MSKNDWQAKPGKSSGGRQFFGRRLWQSTVAPRIASWRVSGDARGGGLQPQMHLLRLPVLLLAWIGLAFGTWTVAGWLRPVARPQLILVSSVGRQPMLPLNSCADHDAETLAGLEQILDVSAASSASLGAAELKSLMASLPQSSSSRYWPGWQQTATVVYVNAPGIAVPDEDGQLTAWILPDDFPVEESGGRFRSDLAVSVDALLERISHLPTDHQMLVLDCQRVDHLWPQGIVSNQFVEAVQEHLARHGSRYPRVHVLCSSSPGEITWVDDSTGMSVFARSFIRGISGAADSTPHGDGRISLVELSAYVRDQVAAWVLKNRADSQNPVLLNSGGSGEDIILAAVDPTAPPVNATASDHQSPTAEEQELLASLQQSWAEYARLRRLRPHPVRSAPHLWRQLETTLMRSESLYRAGRLASMRDELQKVSWRVRDLHVAMKPLYRPERAVSLALQEQFGPQDDPAKAASPASSPGVPAAPAAPNDEETTPVTAVVEAEAPPAGTTEKTTAPAEADAGTATAKAGQAGKAEPAPGPATLAAVRRLVADVIAERISPQEAGQLLGRSSLPQEQLPVEAELLRMLVEHSSHGVDSPAGLSGRMTELLRLRVLGEQASVAAGAAAPDVYRWVQPLIDLADRQQRKREDLFFIHELPESQSISIGPVASVEAEPGTLYRQALREAQTVAHAMTVRELALAELPLLAQAAAHRGWGEPLAEGKKPDGTPGNVSSDQAESKPRAKQESQEHEPAAAGEDLHTTLFRLTLTMNGQIRELSRALSGNPAEWTAAERRNRLTAVEAVSVQLDRTRSTVNSTLTSMLPLLLRQTAGSEVGSQIVWRRMNLLLMLPPVGNRDQTADAMAATRIALLKASRKPVASPQPSPNGAPLAEVPTAESQDSKQLLTSRIQAGRDLALGFLSVDGSELPATDRNSDPAGFSRSVADSWARLRTSALRAMAMTSPSPQEQLTADTACRILNADLTVRLFGAEDRVPTREQRRRNLVAYLEWQAGRRLADFWRGPPDASRDWFAAVAGWSLGHARQLATEAADPADLTGQRLKSLTRLAQELRTRGGGGVLTATAASPRLRGTDQTIVQVELDASELLPAGEVALDCRTGSDRLTASALNGTPATSAVSVVLNEEGAPVPALPAFGPKWQLSRKGFAGFSTTLTAQAFYRGHVCQVPLAVSAADETTGPTVEIRTTPADQGELLVRWSRLAQPSASVLFVIDCSRSMHRNQRLQTVKDTLQQFASVAASSGLSVGLRVFGDRVVWKGEGDPLQEAAARRDSRLLLPVQPFPGAKFGQVTAGLQARGETPLFHALLEAGKDLEDVPSTRKVVVLISDGADNWAQAGRKPGVRELQTAWQNSGIHIHCIGFQTDAPGWEQLQQIASLTDGTCVQASRAEELLESIFGMAGLFTWEAVRRDGNGSALKHTEQLNFDAAPLTLDPGVWDLRVLRHDGTVAAELKSVQIEAGQRHELHFTGDRLSYPRPVLSGDIADARDTETGTLLRVLSAEHHQGGLELTLALLRQQDPAWNPRQVQFRIRPRGTGYETIVDSPPQNVAGHAFPVWKFRVDHWPETASFAEVTASWSAGTGSPRLQHSFGWPDRHDSIALPPGFELTRRRVETKMIDGKLENVVLLTLALPAGYPQPQEWTFAFDQPVQWSRRSWNVEDGVCTGWFRFPSNRPPRQVLLNGPYTDDSRHSLSATLNLQLRKINSLATRPDPSRN